VPSTFEASKGALAKKMASEKAHNDVYDVQNEIEDARAGGMTLKEAAEKYNLTLTTFKGLSADGKDIDGKEPANLPEDKNLLKSVFENGQGDQIPPVDGSDGGYYWVAIDNVTPAKLQPLKDVRQKVIDLWKTEMRKTKLQELAQDLATRGDKGETIDKLAASVDRAPLVVSGIKRDSQNDTFSRLAVSRLFALPQGGFTSAPVGFGDSMLVMQVKSIDDPKFDPKSKDYTETQTSLEAGLSNDMLVSLVAGNENALGTKINTKLLDSLASENQ
jgi:peptidyl-prolyl cis-trans isomerase D